MENFSIESAIDRISDPRSKEYFQEVNSSYRNGNYRSAVVMLWTTVVCDLIYKLQTLRDIHNDTTANEIIQHIEARQRANPKAPDWETELLRKMKERTELLDEAEYEGLLHLQNTRHLSAHPILGASDLLYKPTREATRALIRLALDSVLLKPPILTKKIVEELVVDLAAKKDILIEDSGLTRYLEARYLRGLRPATENYLFRSLWKFVFQLSNTDTNANRDINFRALKVVYSRQPGELREFIRGDQDHFSNVLHGEPLNYLIEFLSENPSVYLLLTDSARVPIQGVILSDFNQYALATFLNPDLPKHLAEVSQRVSGMAYTGAGGLGSTAEGLNKITWDRLYPIAREHDCQSLMYDIAVQMYVKSINFDSAARFYRDFVVPHIEHFTKEQLVILLKGIEGNNQTYGRRGTNVDHKIIKNRCDAVFGNSFDYAPYPNFIQSVLK